MSRRSDLLPDPFVRGRTHYDDAIPGFADPYNRIVLLVQFGSTPRTLAVLDTASPFCILSPDEAARLKLDYRTEGEILPRSKGINIRGITLPGWVCRVPITLKADEGQNLTVEASVFVPELEPTQQWMLPNFLGLSGFLDRIRFAVDPQENWFYFGAFEE